MFIFGGKLVRRQGPKELVYSLKMVIEADQSSKQRVLDAYRQSTLIVLERDALDMFSVGHILIGENRKIHPGDQDIPWPWWDSEAREREGD